MTMKKMDEYLEACGFKVNRIYIPAEKHYRFTIAKDGQSHSDVFAYPEGVGPEGKQRRQEVFLDKLVQDFKKAYPFPDKRMILDDVKTQSDLQKYAHDNDYIITIERRVDEPGIITVERCGDKIVRRIDASDKSNEQIVGFIKKMIRMLEDNEIDEKCLYPGFTQYIRYFMNAIYGASKFEIKKVIFNAPATIVLWADGTKTVVKATNEEYDPEKGLAMAISKKALGNKREYYHTFLHWLKKYKNSEELTFNIKLTDVSTASKAIEGLAKVIREVRRGEV